MDNRIVLAFLAALALAACDNPRQKAIEAIDRDSEIMRKAGAAVNEVIRNSTDCEAAKPLLVEAYRGIEDARREVKAPASQQTLNALQAQVDRVKEVCP